MEIQFTSEKIRLAGFRLEATGKKIHDTLLIFCHGLPSGKPPEPGDAGYKGLVERFSSLGYPSLFFNFRGAGDSEGDFSLVGWKKDLISLIDYLKQDESPTYRQIVVIASSAGALAALAAAGDEPGIDGICTLAAPERFDFLGPVTAKLLIAHFKEIGLIRDPGFPKDAKSWFADFLEINAANGIKKLNGRPALFLHGEQDEVVPVEHLKRLRKAAGKACRWKVFTGAGHRLRHEEAALLMIERWLANEFP